MESSGSKVGEERSVLIFFSNIFLSKYQNIRKESGQVDFASFSKPILDCLDRS